MILPKEETGLPPLTTQTAEFYRVSRFDVPQSIHGLISFGNFGSVTIWNPTLRQHVTLPEPKVSRPLISLLGYDPIGDEYKVLCMSLCEDARNNGEDPQILTMGAQESWRPLMQNIPSPIHCDMKNWRCIKGVVYYFAAGETIVSFDVRSEKFGVIQIPGDVRCAMITSIPTGLLRHRGRLWVLEDAEKHEWSREESILPFVTNNILSGETADDELIYLPRFTDGPFYAIYYDLERNSARKVVYDGISEDKNFKFKFQCFPNHIESLMSLNNLLAGA